MDIYYLSQTLAHFPPTFPTLIRNPPRFLHDNRGCILAQLCCSFVMTITGCCCSPEADTVTLVHIPCLCHVQVHNASHVPSRAYRKISRCIVRHVAVLPTDVALALDFLLTFLKFTCCLTMAATPLALYPHLNSPQSLASIFLPQMFCFRPSDTPLGSPF
jgi:hypothetical protein